jgi:hypothetical protein
MMSKILNLNDFSKKVFADVQKDEEFWSTFSLTLINMMLENYDNSYVEEKTKKLLLAYMYLENQTLKEALDKFKLALVAIRKNCGIENKKGQELFDKVMDKWVSEQEETFKKDKLYGKAQKKLSPLFFMLMLMSILLIVALALSSIGGGIGLMGSLITLPAVFLSRKIFTLETIPLTLKESERLEFTLKYQNEAYYAVQKRLQPKQVINGEKKSETTNKKNKKEEIVQLEKKKP